MRYVLKPGDPRPWAYEEGSGDGFYEQALAEGGTPLTQADVDAINSPSLDQVRALKVESIKAERDRRIQYGGYKVGSNWFHSDTFSRTQQIGLVMLGANIPANTQWKTMDGTFTPMTQALAGQIFATAAASDLAIFAKAEMHRAAMQASSDPANYPHLTGWPVAFGEE